jgi:integrase
MNGKENVARRPKARSNGEGTVFQRSDGRWLARVTVGLHQNGRQKFREKTAPTEREALAHKRKLLESLHAGTLKDPEKATVADFLERWLVSREGQVKPRTLQLYQYELRHYAIPRIGRVKLPKLTGLQVQAMQEAIRAQVREDSEGKSDGARTAAGVTATVRRALSQAVQWDLITRNPAEGVKQPRVVTREVRALTSHEVARLLKAAENDRMYALYYLAVFTGMRRGELLALHWREVDLPRRMLRVRQTITLEDNKPALGDPKSKRSRRSLPLTEDMVQVLEAHRERQKLERRVMDRDWTEHGLVFPATNGALVFPSNFSRDFMAVRKLAGLTDVTFHELRHTYASMAIRSRQVDILKLSARLGHESAAFTVARYGHLIEEVYGPTATSLEALLGGTLEEMLAEDRELTKRSETLVSGSISGKRPKGAGELN